jgi:predicted RNA-binding Zn-ribbon protein involved in translation (DUF1610 family)
MTVGFLAKCASGGRPKKRHASRQEAEEHRSMLIRRQIWTKSKSNTYRCNACGFWHAGSTGQVNRGQGKGHRKGKRR